jgi:hypothetical protein
MKHSPQTRRVIWVGLMVGLGISAAVCVHHQEVGRTRVSAAPQTKVRADRLQRPSGQHRQALPLQADVRANERDQPEPIGELELLAIRDWAETDLRAAADWVNRMPASLARHEAINGIAIVWANGDLPSAIQWALQLPDGTERQSVMMSVAYEAVRAEPTEALTLAFELPANQTRDDLIAHAAAEWAATEPEAAVEYANQIPDAALRETVLASIATAWSDSDPIAAASLAGSAIAGGRQQDDAVVGIVLRWMQQDAAATEAWVTLFPEGTLRETALENLARFWPNPEQTGD